MSDVRVKFTLLQNGLDFILSAVKYIASEPSDSDLKYAVLHLTSGIELIFKERLYKENWKLIFENINKADEQKLKEGDFTSISFKCAIKRIEKNCGIELDEHVKKDLEKIRNIRNKILHFEFETSVVVMKSLCSRTLNFLYDFIHEELSPVDEYKDKLKEIIDYAHEFKEFVDERMKKVREQIQTNSYSVKTCPECFQEALVIDDGVECFFCRYTASGEDAAYAYVSSVIKLSDYEIVKDGGEWPVYDCPACNMTSLVQEDTNQYTCFSCGEQWAEHELQRCYRCGVNLVIMDGNDDAAICDICIERMLAE